MKAEIVMFKEFMVEDDNDIKFPAFKVKYKYLCNNKTYYSSKVRFTSYVPGGMTYNADKWTLQKIKSKFRRGESLNIWVHKNWPGFSVIDKKQKFLAAICCLIVSTIWPVSWLIHIGK